MKTIQIGESDLFIPPFNLGGNVFGWTIQEKESFEILDAYVDAGYSFIDTADTYSHWANGGVGGQSETIIGDWIKSRGGRDKIVLATKTGSGQGGSPNDSSRKHIMEAIDQSLHRLKTDYIDLYYTHYDDEHTPVEETLSAYQDLIKAGKIRYVAVSNISPERLRLSLETAQKNGLPQYVALQPFYNLMKRKKYEEEFAPIVEKYNLTVFPYYALASGFLTGKYRTEADLNKSVRGAGLKNYLEGKGPKVLAALDQISEKHKTSQAAVALAWLYTRPHVGCPISSVTSVEQLKQSLAGVSLTLDQADLKLLNEASK